MLAELRAGHQMPAYAYARNNPVAYTDPTGLLTYPPFQCFDENGSAYWTGGKGPGRTLCGDVEWLERQAMVACAISESCSCKALLRTLAAARFQCGLLPPPSKPKPTTICGDRPEDE